MTSTTLPAATAALTLSFAPESKIRTVLVDGEPWFVAADVCAVLGIAWKGAGNSGTLASLDPDEKAVHSMHTLGGAQRLATVNESGLYTLALRCNGATKPGSTAHRFRKWITADVLPTLRKYGTYPAPQVRQHPQRPARPADRITDTDVMNLRIAVRLIAHNHVPAVRRACWAAIRAATGVQQASHLRVSDLPLAVEALRGCAMVLGTIDRYRGTVEKFAIEQIVDGHAGAELAASVDEELHVLGHRVLHRGFQQQPAKEITAALARIELRRPPRAGDLNWMAAEPDDLEAGTTPRDLLHLE